MSDSRRTLRSGKKYEEVSNTESVTSDAESMTSDAETASDRRIGSPSPTIAEASELPAEEYPEVLRSFAMFYLENSDDDEVARQGEDALRKVYGFLEASDREGTEGDQLRPDPARWTGESVVPVDLRHKWKSLSSSGETMSRPKRRYNATCESCEETYGGAQSFWLERCEKGKSNNGLTCKNFQSHDMV